MGTNDLRFGIRVGNLRSRCWRVRAGANKPELFIEREGLQDDVHLSLHESGRWHMKVLNEKKYQWLRPDEIHPGFTRAVAIVQPASVATVSVDAPADAVLVELNTDGDAAAHFNVFIEQPSASPITWPGSNAMGTELIGRIPLAHRHGTCCLVMQRAAAPAGSLTSSRPSGPQVDAIKQAASEDALYMTLINHEPDGAVSLIDGRALIA